MPMLPLCLISAKHGIRGTGVEAPRPPPSSWQVEALDQGEEPEASGDEPGDGDVCMTTVGRLLTRKQELTARLRENPSPHERDEIERLLEKIDTALDLLGVARPGVSGKDEK